MIIGFDNADVSIFEAQSRFVRDARIVNAMVNMLVAVPRTPLQLIVETAFIFLRLISLVRQAGLRREYQRRMWRFLKRRPEPVVLQVYAIKCAMHYHAHMMVQQTLSNGSVINSF
jgi:hypothetical protein